MCATLRPEESICSRSGVGYSYDAREDLMNEDVSAVKGLHFHWAVEHCLVFVMRCALADSSLLGPLAFRSGCKVHDGSLLPKNFTLSLASSDVSSEYIMIVTEGKSSTAPRTPRLDRRIGWHVLQAPQ